ncbi:protein of unknown function [Listeria monocytogenes R479a]|nr:protein of unknown function [Listeria monocytogenes R479a]CUK46907.1 hypothetical protein LM500401_60140 [Listeria monocytogenes]CUL73206.1 hypothetical protein LM801457_30382 [Listeria monocytogenes]CUM23562.1 hypothetical protein LM901099_70142 [Listeria monocytogenes]
MLKEDIIYEKNGSKNWFVHPFNNAIYYIIFRERLSGRKY